jgi:uncharacterized membrane protein YkoI
MKPLNHIAALVLGLISITAPAAAAPELDSILPIVQQQLPGSMLDAREPQPAPSKSESYYQIKWLTKDGRVVWLTVDARTGRISR